jgi:hypothetical protein
MTTPAPSAAANFWNQFLDLVKTTVIKDAGPDLIKTAQIVQSEGLAGLMTPLGQAQVIQTLTALQADAMTAGNDLTKEIAGLVVAYIQAQLAKTGA